MCDFPMEKILEQIRMISMNFWTHFPSFSFIMVIFIHTNRYRKSKIFLPECIKLERPQNSSNVVRRGPIGCWLRWWWEPIWKIRADAKLLIRKLSKRCWEIYEESTFFYWMGWALGQKFGVHFGHISGTKISAGRVLFGRKFLNFFALL